MKNINNFPELVKTFGTAIVGAEKYWRSCPAKNGTHWLNVEGKEPDHFNRFLFFRKPSDIKPVIIFEGVRLDDQVVLCGGNIIGALTTISHSTLMEGAKVGSDCDISDTIIGRDSVIESGSHQCKTCIVSSVLDDNVRVGSESAVSKSDIGYGAVIEDRAKLPKNIVRQSGRVTKETTLSEDYIVPAKTSVSGWVGEITETREPRFMLKFDFVALSEKTDLTKAPIPSDPHQSVI